MPEVIHVNVRFPPDIHAKAVELAKANHNSLNGLILLLVDQAAKKALR